MRKFFVAAVLGAWLGFLTLLPRGSSYIWLAFGERQYRSWQVFLDQPTWVPWMARALALLLVLLYALWAAEQGYLAPKPRHQKLGMIWWVSVSLLSAANLVFAPEKVLSLVGWLLAGLFLILSWLPRLGKRPADWAWRVLACEMALVGLFSAWLGLVLQLWPQVLRDHVAELPLLVPAALAWGAVVGMSAVLPIVWLGPAPGQALRAAPLLALGMLLGWWLGPSSSSLPGGLGGSEPSFFTVHLCGPGRPVETVPSMPVDLLGSEVPRLEAWWREDPARRQQAYELLSKRAGLDLDPNRRVDYAQQGIDSSAYYSEQYLYEWTRSRLDGIPPHVPLLVRPWSRLPATGHPSVRGRLLLDGRPLVGQPVALVPFWDETRFDWKFDSFALTCGYRAVRTDAEGRFNFAELGDPMAELLLRFDHPVILENQHRDWIRLGDGRGPDIDLGTFRLTEP